MATIHGAIYEWGTFEPLENVIVEVNSTPPQSMLAKYGIYSFNLVPGNYLITASYYRNSTRTHYTEEEITITDDGDYVIDIIFLPTYYEEEQMNGTGFDELDELADLAESDSSGENVSFSTLIFVLALLCMILGGAYVLSRRQGEDENPQDGSVHLENDSSLLLSDELADLPADLREVVGIISNNGGRITQKDLRSKLRHSEAKVSLMISDLENRGVVQKFKKGRGNVIILVGAEQANQNV
ncbi:MAG: hypothetical protein SCH66_04495 [Methanolobus sp.]|nr:hypothetical protein [Methanolobus sp.]